MFASCVCYYGVGKCFSDEIAFLFEIETKLIYRINQVFVSNYFLLLHFWWWQAKQIWTAHFEQ